MFDTFVTECTIKRYLKIIFIEVLSSPTQAKIKNNAQALNFSLKKLFYVTHDGHTYKYSVFVTNISIPSGIKINGTISSQINAC